VEVAIVVLLRFSPDWLLASSGHAIADDRGVPSPLVRRPIQQTLLLWNVAEMVSALG
jgi:hypothetical protein